MPVTTINGNSHLAERLEGGQYSNDFIDGLGGNDTIVGHNGVDWLVGNNGDDKIYAGPNDTDLDVVIGGNGKDEIYGGGGGDLMDGGTDDDMMGGGTGNDLMFGDSGPRSLDSYSQFATDYTGAGQDNPFNIYSYLTGSEYGVDDNYFNSFNKADSGDDTMWGGTGRDAMFGGWGKDVVGGGHGNDLVVGNRGDDTLYGGATGNDVLLGGDEDDVIYGGTGNDILDGDITPGFGPSGDEDYMNPADGKDVNGDGEVNDDDVAPSFSPEPVTDHENDGEQGTPENDRGTNSTDIGNDFLGDTEWVSNSSNQNGDDLLFGGDGNDLILGREGADTIWGGAGDDLLKGGMDDDSELDNDTDVFSFISGHGNDTVSQFKVVESPEGGNDSWESSEDVIYLEGGSYDGEFRDAVDAGHIVIDEEQNTVLIYTEEFGLDDDDSETESTILIVFEDDTQGNGAEAFGAGNIAFENQEEVAPNWVDITTSTWQSIDFDNGGGQPAQP